MSMILHCTTRTAWTAALARGSYVAASLQTQGFIHFSTIDQVVEVADRLFRGQRDLVLLCVNTDRLVPEVRYENLEGGTTLYPHVYGPIDVNVVMNVVDFPPKEDGTFQLPRIS